MTEPEESGEQSLVMPFLPVVTKGGPWDDDAYVAGYAMGLLAERLATGPGLLVDTVHQDNREQADLLAMRYGYRAEFQPSDVSPWVYMRFTRLQEVAP